MNYIKLFLEVRIKIIVFVEDKMMFLVELLDIK